MNLPEIGRAIVFKVKRYGEETPTAALGVRNQFKLFVDYTICDQYNGFEEYPPERVTEWKYLEDVI